jgi:hypothetical protein
MAVTLSNKTKREVTKQIECGDSIPDFYLPLLLGPLLIEIQDKATTCNNQTVLAQLRSLGRAKGVMSLPLWLPRISQSWN